MDQDAKDRVIEDINLSRGFEKEIRRVFIEENNQDMVSRKQEQAIRSRMTTGEAKTGDKFEKNGRTFIKVHKDNYKRVTSNNDVYVTDSGTIFLRTPSGRFKKAIK